MIREKDEFIIVGTPPSKAFAIVWLLTLVLLLAFGLYKPLLFLIPLFVLSGLFGFSSVGVKFDLEKQRFKAFTRFFLFIETGQWKSMQHFQEVAILKVRQRSSFFLSMFVTAQEKQISWTDNRYKLMLLSKSHRTKIQLAKVKTYEEARALSKKLINITSLSLVKYNPKSVS